ncbi:Uu.00g030880.m01.CDS01 [Anthostomella pinea]|uniref:Uu.00g030880.m01.CDS01 n=1 Tax=Anthostomella pinea TaxID=933095 RepID=A0AAI8YD00_9PEZI|nr:Uu.00g030880.m01.CDS01 [Anthostomella pinea]
MEWSLTSPGVSQAFKPIGREHWGLYIVCSFELGPSLSGRNPSTALRDAWKTLRQEFPALAVNPDALTKKTYAVPSSVSVDEWANETFFVESSADPDDVVASYPSRDTPSLYFFPTRSQILFLCSHWRIDGLGTCMLLERFFTILAQGQPAPNSWTDGIQSISPSLEDAAGAPRTENPELVEFAQGYIEDHHRNAVHAGGLPYAGDTTTPPGRASYSAITFDPQAQQRW